MYEFPCPHCQTPLRLRDQALRGRTVDCPDCSEPVLIVEQGNQLIGQPTTGNSAASPPNQHLPVGPSQTPKWIAASVAVALLLGLAIFVVTGDKSVDDVPSTGTDVTATDDGDPYVVLPDETTIDETPPIAVEDSASDQFPIVPNDDPVAARLARIHGLFQSYVAQQGQLPGATNESDSQTFSWIADLNAWKNPGIRMDRDQSWSDPVNSSFVRRRFQEFENPQIPLAAGDDGFPPTHFVGIAGVGADAGQLPEGHPRAGIFSQNHRTSLHAIPDGASQTMLVAGIVKGHGSWARPDSATVRPFTAEPYIQGPDGFGTGDPQRMPVLMADGSVREISGKTDGVIVRRMAAMADGLALDPTVPGDPLAMNPQPEVPADPDPANEPPEQPQDEPLIVDMAVEDVPQIPVRRAEDMLKQQLAGYRQEQPVPFEDLILEFEELVAVPVDQSQLPSSIRETRVQLKQEGTTLREILDAITHEAGAKYVVEPGRIVLLPSSAELQ